MKKLLLAGLLWTPILLFGQQLPKNLTATNGVFIGFYEYKPVDYNANPATSYPLIIFLHGIGERGDGVTNLPLVLSNGIPRNINTGHTMRFFWNGKWETFLVLSPQLSTVYGDWQDFYVEEMIKYAKQNLRVDPNRIFLTGLSLGGGGVWSYSSASATNARELAGIAPVCGTCSIKNACNIANANLPVWAFHAQDDGVVGFGCTTSTITSINNCNAPVKPLMSIYSSGGHSIWNRSYDTEYNYHDPNMYEWFLGQNKSLPVNILPIARAGNDLTISSAIGTASLNGSSSTDGDGNLVRFTWRKISGPATGTIISPVSPNGITSVTGLTTIGTYSYELKVLDNRTSAALDTLVITVNANVGGGNNPPVSNAGSDIAVTLPTNNTTLNGSGSIDPDGTITAYSWNLLTGPSTVAITNSTNISTSVAGLIQGTYSFQLTVSDNNGVTNTDIVNVTVNPQAAPPPSSNQLPVAKAGNNFSIGLPTNTATLDGSGSYDPDGTIASYLWKKINGPTNYTSGNLNNVTVQLSNLVAGTYGFQLIVTDNSGGISIDYISVTVNPSLAPPPPNIKPVANAGSTSTITLPTSNTILNGSASSDPDGTIVSYLWKKINGPAQYTITNTTNATTTVNNLVAGVYIFRLTVIDNMSAADSTTVTVNVNAAPQNPANQPPNANAGANTFIVLPTNSTTLNGSSSSDPDGTIVSYLWKKINGPDTYTIGNLNNPTVPLSNLSPGTYGFQLTVTDNSGAIGIAYTSVTVAPGAVGGPLNQLPIANGGPNFSISLPTNSATLKGTDSYDPDGSIVLYSWSKIGGPGPYTFSNTSSASTIVSNLVQGVYTFLLSVTDNSGATDTDTVTLTVNYGTTIPPYGGGNQHPVANAGGNPTISLPTNSTTLNGSSSFDPDGSIVSYTWKKVSGPDVYAIGNLNNATVPISNLIEGTYGFQLVVTDNSGAIGIDYTTLTVTAGIPPPVNHAPVAKAGNNITIDLPLNSTTLNGSASYDPDGSIVSYSWKKINGPDVFSIGNVNSVTVPLSNLIAGTYGFQLTVTDNSGAVSFDYTSVTVNPSLFPPPPNRHPIANAGGNPSISLPTNSTTLNGSSSSDPDGTIVSYQWKKINGPDVYTIGNLNAAIVPISNLIAGSYGFQLTVTDNNGAIGIDYTTLTVNNIAVSSFVTKKESSSSVLEKTTISCDKIIAYPNPASSAITIRYNSDTVGQSRMIVYDVSGRVVRRYDFYKNSSAYEVLIPINDLNKGLYFIEIVTGTRKKVLSKFIKQ